jgi:hypothetical protein
VFVSVATHGTHPRGHLELLQLSRDVRHVRRPLLVPEHSQQLIQILILLPHARRHRHHIVLEGAYVVAASRDALLSLSHPQWGGGEGAASASSTAGA